MSFRWRFIRDHELEDPVDRRGWCFQERLCAQRYLAFGRDEMRWECRETSSCECDRERMPSDIRSPGSGGKALRTIDTMLRAANIDSVLDSWRYKIVPEYTSRELTFHSDKLVAISAVAAKYHARCGLEYVAGLWKEDLVQQLLWRTHQVPQSQSPSLAEHFATDATEMVPAAIEDHGTPSWSWASVKCPIKYDWEILNVTRHTKEEFVKVLEARATPCTPNSFGPVKDGTIKLMGKIVEATIIGAEVQVKNQNIGSAVLDVPSAVSIPVSGDHTAVRQGANAEDTKPMGPRMSVWVLPLFLITWSNFDTEGELFSLLLRSSDGSLRSYKRIGVIPDPEGQRELRGDWKTLLAAYEDCEVTLT
ncbi:MAG: hypothetical protein Q9160_003783 [Pyrenula sp. 1 TL-2023]